MNRILILQYDKCLKTKLHGGKLSWKLAISWRNKKCSQRHERTYTAESQTYWKVRFHYRMSDLVCSKWTEKCAHPMCAPARPLKHLFGIHPLADGQLHYDCYVINMYGWHI